MTTPRLHYPARSQDKIPAYTSLSQRVRPPFAAARPNASNRPAHVTMAPRAGRSGAYIGAAIVGGIGLAVGCVAIAVNWLLAVETQASDLLGAAEWAAKVTMLGLASGGIAGGLAGMFVDAAMRILRRSKTEPPARERMKVA